jgi:MFS family permease
MGFAAGALVLGGLLLTRVSWGFLAIAALGAFGPGILRELGILRDQDEFQRRAAHRAGYHAYLAGGSLAFLLIAYLRSGQRNLEHPEELATVFLSLLWFTWLLSSLIGHWGRRRTAFRILMIFGGLWLIFNVLSGWGNLIGVLMQSLLALPFFALAFLSRRWPRIAGAVLLLATAFFFTFFNMHEILSGKLERTTVFVLFLGPLLGSGLALLTSRCCDEGGQDHSGQDRRSQGVAMG